MRPDVVTFAFLLSTAAAHQRKGYGNGTEPQTTGKPGWIDTCYAFHHKGIPISCASTALSTKTYDATPFFGDNRPPQPTGTGSYGQKRRHRNRGYGEGNQQTDAYTALSPAPSSGTGQHVCDRIKPAHLDYLGLPIDFEIYPCYAVGGTQQSSLAIPSGLPSQPLPGPGDYQPTITSSASSAINTGNAYSTYVDSEADVVSSSSVAGISWGGAGTGTGVYPYPPYQTGGSYNSYQVGASSTIDGMGATTTSSAATI